MGKRGPPPQSPEDAKLRGTFQPHRHAHRGNAVRPDGELAAEAAPVWMTEAQRTAWCDILARVPAGLVSKLDRELFANYVVTWVRFRDAAAAQNRLDHDEPFPLLRRRANGVYESAYLSIMHRASLLLLRQAVQLGFSPATRARMAADGFSPAKPEPNEGWQRLQRFSVIEGDKH